MHEFSAYGLWGLVIINSAVFIVFAASFTRLQTKRDWRSLRRLLRLHPRTFH